MEGKIKSASVGVLLSGGLDSAALISRYAQGGYTIWPIYVRFGLRWESQELWWAKKLVRHQKNSHLKTLQILSLPLDHAYDLNWSQTGKIPQARSSDSAVFLPARNLLLITKALLFLSSKNVFHVALGTLKGNPFQDAQTGYVKSLERLLARSFNHPIQISTPFRQFTKKQLIQTYRATPFHLSFSCINPNGNLHCGKCNKCAERKRAFQEANAEDKTVYARG